MEDDPTDDQETVTSWTNPWIAEYNSRQAMLMEMRAFEVIAMTRDLNLTSYAFSKNAEELQNHIWRYPEIGQSQPFNPDVGDPFGIELARLLANFLASVKSLVSGQRAVLRDIWPKIGKQLSEFESGEYTTKRLAVFEADEAKLLEELRNYSQHKFLPYLNPAWQFSQAMPMTEFQFRLHVEPLLKWDSLNAEVRKYLQRQGDSIDLLPIIGRYTAAVREFYGWFWLKIDEKTKPERVEYDAHVAELMVFGEEVFLTPDWIRRPGGEQPPGWNGKRWRRRSLAEIRQRRWALGHRSFRGITVDNQGGAEVGEHPWTPILLRVP
ncbi:hypothetical protein [Mycobacterium branderi]|uniref:Uncharacterized protein n=1 Tax=Mycobacterium branderi TaxID=43348 RepID=A0A7I7W6J6_9MYCO|nr:hypothetical protein [Mycobacterium branderi]MCV7236012.1 hypothetical protein [Mycobacterium branderi]ORA31238.1 hypothetical protein BST20_27190 [Mycobacterium branderi]BBZ12073.1 hypothetical protein MBRA_22680 [Mycobacterium branderi]